MAHTSPDGCSVAVVIPTCRRPTLLPRALRSVIAQTRLPDVVVVADVGGESWSAETETLLVPEGTRLRHLVLSPDAQAGAARNRGAAASASSWLAFLDDDDVWDPTYLERALALIEPGVDAVATRLRLRRDDATVSFPPISESLLPSDVLVRNPGITGNNLVINAATFDRIGGYDPALAAYNDLDFLVRALDAGAAFRINQEALVEQLVHSEGQATGASPRRLAAFEVYVDRYRSRMTVSQRITVRRDRYRMLKHLDNRRASRLAHWAGDLVLTSPHELVIRLRRRFTLRGGYD